MAQMWRKLDQFQQINYQAHSSSNTMPTVQRPPGYRLPNKETTHNYRQPFPQHQGEEAYESSPEPQLPPSQDYQITTRIQQNKAFKQALSSTTSKFNGSDAQEYVEWKRSFQLETGWPVLKYAAHHYWRVPDLWRLGRLLGDHRLVF